MTISPASTLILSPQAVLLLRLHASRSADLFYGIEARGSINAKADAYLELADLGLMQPTTAIGRFFGEPKRLFRITTEEK